MHEDTERCLRAVRSRDRRFDGWFFTGVRSTGIYCRPSCPALTPRPEQLTFHATAAAAQAAGYRACKRCRPDATPGSPEWDHRADVVARAMRLIADGVVDREGVTGLAARLGYSTRQLERHLRAEVGAGPLALARAQRSQTARTLIETTRLPMAEVAFAAGFGSIRSFNDTVRTIYDRSPTALRERARLVPGAPQPGTVVVRLPARTPLQARAALAHLVATAVPGVEEWRDGSYRRTLRLPHGHGIVALRGADDHIVCRLQLTDVRDLAAATSRCRRLLDLDADPCAIDDHLAADPALAPLVGRTPGRRVPRTVDADELAVRAVLGQQVSTAAARTHAGRLVRAHGEPVDDPAGGLTHRFPTAESLTGLGPEELAMPAARRDALHGLVDALTEGRLDLGPGADWGRARAELATIRGIGPWTIETIAMRALGDPDAFLPTDLGVRAAAERRGLTATPAALARHAQRWRPWRAYAVQYLWSAIPHDIHQLPDEPAA